jgi:hypothetical protein
MNERERKVLSQVCKEVLKIDAHIGFASVVDGTGKLLVAKSRTMNWDIICDPLYCYSCSSFYRDYLMFVLQNRKISPFSIVYVDQGFGRSYDDTTVDFEVVGYNNNINLLLTALNMFRDRFLCIYFHPHYNTDMFFSQVLAEFNNIIIRIITAIQ